MECEMEINKYLTEAMGECWHEVSQKHIYYGGCGRCIHCKKIVSVKYQSHECVRVDFTTWTGFGKLWEWATKQDWWPDFAQDHCWYNPNYYVFIKCGLINPTTFAKAIYEFRKEPKSGV